MTEVQVEVDQAVCVGSRWCTSIAPLTFEVDDTGKAITTDPSQSSIDELEEAEESCPVAAIRLQLGQALTTNQE